VFVAISNAGLRNNVAYYTANQKVLLSKPYTLPMALMFLLRDYIFESFLFLLLLNSWTKQEICDKCVKGHKRRTSVHVENDGAAREAGTRSPKISVWRVAQQRGISTSTAWIVCYGDFLLLPYKMQLRRLLSDDVIARCYAFAREYVALLKENPGVLNVIWFSNDAHFHLDDYLNK
jgi:hypothetical protein